MDENHPKCDKTMMHSFPQNSKLIIDLADLFALQMVQCEHDEKCALFVLLNLIGLDLKRASAEDEIYYDLMSMRIQMTTILMRVSNVWTVKWLGGSNERATGPKQYKC